MTWLVNEQELTQAQQFRHLLKEHPGIIQMPGAHDAMTGIIAKKVDFPAIYLSGGAFSASLGMPDLGIITLTELVTRAREIIRATNLPMLVDIDTGFGSVLNVTRTVKELADAGVAAIQIEDQDLPKKCGHLNGKKIVSTEEMMQKVQAARKADKEIVIIARTDAKAMEGIDAAIERAKQYVEAGADAIFPEALQTEEEFKQFAEAMDVPLLANMTEFGKTPYYTAEQFEEWGYKMVIYPVTSLRVAAKAVERVFEEIKQSGTQKDSVENMQTRKELYESLQLYDYEALDESIAQTVLDDK
ncbi:methylisocitrate lyase [Oceanobacillus saliphilus]|uniref:methylisocitrate lyase n=1 Tax=Oceanobacillus saliphilus TaxID=2925834 RepID=UPI00201DC67B|nr:methylisocitrate lyase [Oceanobacillus saliphilus]